MSSFQTAFAQASADMVSLYSLVPSTARLVLNPDNNNNNAINAQSNGSNGAASASGTSAGHGSAATREVPAESITNGDVIRVLPGDRLPVDGVVTGGRTTVDESALTGEPMPVTKAEGDTVTAGTVNVDGAQLLFCGFVCESVPLVLFWIACNCCFAEICGD